MTYIFCITFLSLLKIYKNTLKIKSKFIISVTWFLQPINFRSRGTASLQNIFFSFLKIFKCFFLNYLQKSLKTFQNFSILRNLQIKILQKFTQISYSIFLEKKFSLFEVGDFFIIVTLFSHKYWKILIIFHKALEFLIILSIYPKKHLKNLKFSRKYNSLLYFVIMILVPVFPKFVQK